MFLSVCLVRENNFSEILSDYLMTRKSSVYFPSLLIQLGPLMTYMLTIDFCKDEGLIFQCCLLSRNRIDHRGGSVLIWNWAKERCLFTCIAPVKNLTWFQVQLRNLNVAYFLENYWKGISEWNDRCNCKNRFYLRAFDLPLAKSAGPTPGPWRSNPAVRGHFHEVESSLFACQIFLAHLRHV